MSLEKAQHELTRRGNCGGMQDLFFSTARADWAEAKLVCRRCPVQDVCLAYALEAKETHGVWGGADHRQLREALGLDSNGEPYAYSIVRCPQCRTSENFRIEGSDTPNAKRGWINVRRECSECHLQWVREEPRRLPKRRKEKKK